MKKLSLLIIEGILFLSCLTFFKTTYCDSANKKHIGLQLYSISDSINGYVLAVIKKVADLSNVRISRFSTLH